MEGILGLLVFVGFIVIIVYCVKKTKEKQKIKQEEIAKRENDERIDREKEITLLKEKWDRKIEEFNLYGLPILNIATLQLTKNEVCHFSGTAFFCKQKQETVGYEGGNRGVSFRVMKGVSFRVGNYQGHYVKREVIELL